MSSTKTETRTTTQQEGATKKAAAPRGRGQKTQEGQAKTKPKVSRGAGPKKAVTKSTRKKLIDYVNEGKAPKLHAAETQHILTVAGVINNTNETLRAEAQGVLHLVARGLLTRAGAFCRADGKTMIKPKHLLIAARSCGMDHS